MVFSKQTPKSSTNFGKWQVKNIAHPKAWVDWRGTPLTAFSSS